MIIDLLTEKQNNIIVSDYDVISSNVVSLGYSVKSSSDILSWRLINPSVSSVEIIISSSNTITLSDITYDIIGGVNNSEQIYKIYTSIDYINWYELPFKEGIDDHKYLYKRVDENVFLNMSTLSYDDDTSTFPYIFKRLNEFSNEYEYIYDNLEFKYIKFELSNLIPSVFSPIRFTSFEILVDDFYDDKFIQSNLLEIKAPLLYKQKIFEEENLFPDLLSNYSKMLESNGTTSELVNILSSDIFLNTIE
jgi:hypothetical protein